MEAYELQKVWLDRAFDSAGIERGSWRPGRGVEENRPAARQTEAVDTSTCHLGFRCIIRDTSAPG